jgi:hypothetical protein
MFTFLVSCSHSYRHDGRKPLDDGLVTLMQDKGCMDQTEPFKDRNSKHLAGTRGGDGTVGEFVNDGAVIEGSRDTVLVPEIDETRHFERQEMESTKNHARRRGKWIAMFGKPDMWYGVVTWLQRVSLKDTRMYNGNRLTSTSICTLANERLPCHDDDTSRIGQEAYDGAVKLEEINRRLKRKWAFRSSSRVSSAGVETLQRIMVSASTCRDARFLFSLILSLRTLTFFDTKI